MIIEHTEVPVELEGKGIAGRIVRAALDYARAQKLKVMPLVPVHRRFHPSHRSTRTWCWKVTGTERRSALKLMDRQRRVMAPCELPHLRDEGTESASRTA